MKLARLTSGYKRKNWVKRREGSWPRCFNRVKMSLRLFRSVQIGKLPSGFRKQSQCKIVKRKTTEKNKSQKLRVKNLRKTNNQAIKEWNKSKSLRRGQVMDSRLKNNLSRLGAFLMSIHRENFWRIDLKWQERSLKRKGRPFQTHQIRVHPKGRRRREHLQLKLQWRLIQCHWKNQSKILRKWKRSQLNFSEI